MEVLLRGCCPFGHASSTVGECRASCRAGGELRASLAPLCRANLPRSTRGPCHHSCSKAQRSRSTGHAWPLNTCAPPAHLSLDCFSLTALTVSDKLSIAGKCNMVFLHLGKKCLMLSCILSSWCPKGGEQVVLYQLPCETGLCTSGTVVTGGWIGRHFFRWQNL